MKHNVKRVSCHCQAMPFAKRSRLAGDERSALFSRAAAERGADRDGAA